jgi:uncharacterized protein (TIGR02597 family)
MNCLLSCKNRPGRDIKIISWCVLSSLSVVLFFATGSIAAIGDAVTGAGGMVAVTVPANSDFHITIPLPQEPEFQGTMAAVSGSTITVNQTNGQPSWNPNAFAYVQGTQNTSYSILIASGSSEGMNGLITADGVAGVTVNSGSGSPTGPFTYSPVLDI